MEFILGFDKKTMTFKIDQNNLMTVLEPNKINIESSGVAEVKRSLLEPIGSPRLKEILKTGEKVVIITSDITRPMPSKVVLPILLEELYEANISDKDIKIVFALGSHRKHTEEEKKYLVGEAIYERIECIDSDVENCINLGQTSLGTPVNIFKPVAEADRRICLGNIEYHYFAGYSGGAKAIMPGVATREAIQANHSMMVRKDAKAGTLEDNPLRRDIDEISNFLSIDFILNVVLDEKKNIIKSVAGHYLEAHREGCKFLDQLYKIYMEQPADIVVVSPGGFPKDINVYQAQKALDNAQHAVRDGGIIILVASCKEGLGEHTFERWMTTSNSPEEMIVNIQKKFELGGHKAAAIAMVHQRARIFLVSDLEDDFVRKIFLEPYKEVETALKSAYSILGEDAKVLVMPYGGSTLPVVNKA
ncbi:nickel-dependent lactate racemase [Geosporobacter ferrireducens]|uniref:Transcriptional regulator n=1 Tax=Geosporobacter ferrireducens TaxID=1424294 RepID=A0A1D8GNY1_9FIRM|nr:nickel-dependent lactate racemase [Geosporobacter ferrireducens]AOT72577.1 transcriptional regulator [Geosporobacter ferrireducens]MTI54973.1 nickel-dependent lactate racemase [Geosporobacter ferrireducens]